MAARRLVIVMVVLLAISTLAAAFIPTTPRDSGEDTTATQQDPQPGEDPDELNPAPPGGDGLVNAHVRVSNKKAKTIAVRPGDELVLQVSSSVGEPVEIPGLGLVETMSTYAPAVFDIYAVEAGTFDVKTVESDLLVAKIVVSALPPKPDLPAGGAKAKPRPAKPKDEGKSAPSDSAGAGAHDGQGSLTPGPQLQ